MKRHSRLTAGCASMILLASCTAIPQSEPSAAEQHASVAAVPRPPASTPRPAEPPVPLTLAFEGALSQGGVVLGTAPAGTRRLTLDGSVVPVAPDGRFLIAFGRDFGGGADVVATTADGRSVSRHLVIAPRAWKIETLATLPRVSQPSAEFERRRRVELARINAARARDNASDGWRQHFMWPATGRISGLFGSQRIYRGEPGAFHSGVDVAGPVGAPVLAPADGVVVLAADAPFTLEGNLLMVDHGMGLNSAFLHLSRITVREGDVVRRGQKIGEIGRTGRATGPHLHWSMKWRDQRIDPMLLAGAKP